MVKNEKTLDTHAKYYDTIMRIQLLGKNDCFRKLEVKHSGIKKGDKVLEFGCGTGMLTTYLIKAIGKNGKVIGVDVGKEMINIAKNKLKTKKNAEFVIIDETEKLPFKSNSFDVIITSLVMHLLTKKQKQIAFKEMYRVLKPKGNFLCVDFGEPSNWFGKIMDFYVTKLCVRIWPYEKNAIENFRGKIIKYIKNAGFKKIKIVRKDIGFVDYTKAEK